MRQALPTVIFISSTLTQWPDYLSTEDFYRKIGKIADAHGNLRVYPSKTETDRAHHDIRALDIIAKNSAYVFSYRPKTCFGIGQCTLAVLTAEKTALKRGSSCGAADVIITDRSNRDRLRCALPERIEDDANQCNLAVGEHLWFHQEYVKHYKH
jgi:hypothetical protein